MALLSYAGKMESLRYGVKSRILQEFRKERVIHTFIVKTCGEIVQ